MFQNVFSYSKINHNFRIAMPLIKKKGSEPESEEYTFRIANADSYEISAKSAEVCLSTKLLYKYL